MECLGMACGRTKQSQRTFHLHFLTCLGPTFCSINSGKVIVRFLWHWHKKDTGDSCLHHHFMFSKNFTNFKVFPSWKNWEFAIIFPYLMLSFHAIFFWPLGGCFGSLCLNLWWDKGGFFRGLQSSEMRSHILLVMFYEFYHGNSRSPSNHHLG